MPNDPIGPMTDTQRALEGMLQKANYTYDQQAEFAKYSRDVVISNGKEVDDQIRAGSEAVLAAIGMLRLLGITLAELTPIGLAANAAILASFFFPTKDSAYISTPPTIKGTGRGTTLLDHEGKIIPIDPKTLTNGQPLSPADLAMISDSFGSIKKAIDLADESISNFSSNYVSSVVTMQVITDANAKLIVAQLDNVRKAIDAAELARSQSSLASTMPLTNDGAVAGRARGGPVFLGQSYLVGENGPELFSPGRSGYISNDVSSSTSRNVTINLGGISITSTQAHGVTAAVADQIVQKVRQNLLRELQLTRLGSHL